jgi:putative ABC transport system permease protein
MARAASQRMQNGFTSLLRGVIERIAAIPGVTGVAGSDAIPFLVPPREAFVRLEGETADLRSQRMAVSPDYFSVMGIRVVAGTTFDASVMPGDSAIVSEAFEREIAGGSAVGKRFSTSQAPGRQLRVVGVVADVRMDHSERPAPTFYVPLVLFSQFAVRVTGDTSLALPLIRQSLGGSDARVVVTRSTTMRDVLASSLAEEVFRAALSALFGGLALILGLVGANALVVRWVADRRRDIGIRIALGASPAEVSSLVLRKAGMAVAAGIGAGVPAAFVAAQLLGRFLVGVSTASVFIYVAVPVLIAVLALAGAWLPAVRASKMAPVDLFRR